MWESPAQLEGMIFQGNWLSEGPWTKVLVPWSWCPGRFPISKLADPDCPTFHEVWARYGGVERVGRGPSAPAHCTKSSRTTGLLVKSRVERPPFLPVLRLCPAMNNLHSPCNELELAFTTLRSGCRKCFLVHKCQDCIIPLVFGN